jgi:hypothetical protein
MRKDLVLSFGFLILLLILIAETVFTPVSAETIVGSAKFDPRRIDLTLPAPSVVKATIRFDDPYSVKDINTSTILLEGFLPPLATYLIPGGLVAEFDGEMVVNILWAEIYHIGELKPPYKIWLTITGNLRDEAGGTPFEAKGYIKIIVSRSPPPP